MSITRLIPASRAATLAALTAVLFASPALAAKDEHRSASFTGAGADRGTVTHRIEGGHHVLVLSDDFKIPDAPDPHWQIVDSTGTTFLLDRLIVEPGRTLARKIVVPTHVADVSKVQLWGAYAEVILGEATFPSPVATRPPVAMEPTPMQARVAFGVPLTGGEGG